MKIYLKESPRTFIITDASYSLIIRHPNPVHKLHEQHLHRHVPHIHSESKESKSKKSDSTGNKVIVEFIETKIINFNGFNDVTPSKSRHKKLLIGFLGFLNVKGNIHLGFITRATKVASPKVGENIYMIDEVDFYCLNNDEFDIWINKNEEDVSAQHADDSETSSTAYPASSVKKLLQLGHFYFSKDFDVTSTFQKRGFVSTSTVSSVMDSYSERFCWNFYMISDLLDFRLHLSLYEREKFDRAGFLTIMTRGYIKTVNVKVANEAEALLTLISKQACKKSGAIFGEWGCDDTGQVSNFLETEIIVYTERFCFSYVIIRGNVPSFWEIQSKFSQKKIVSSKSNKKVIFTRSFEASQHAFNLHFDSLGQQYGDVHVVNLLLQDSNTYKGELNETFKKHLQSLANSKEKGGDQAGESEVADLRAGSSINYRISWTDFPLSTSFVKRIGYSSSNPSDIVQPLSQAMLDFGAMFFDTKRQSYVGRQMGVFRVNSFDCLGKANFVSKIISQEVIDLAFRDLGITSCHDVDVRHSQLWEENDNVLSKLNINHLAHTSKIQSSGGSSSKKKFRQQVTRKYLNVVGEIKPNEIAMLKLLGRLQDQGGVKLYNPFHQYVTRELAKRANEFSYQKDIRIYASTFNVNGAISEDSILKDWLFPDIALASNDYDLVCIGFEEIVELTPGKMMNVKSDNFVAWEQQVKNQLDMHGPSDEKYLSLWSWQMGGLAIMLFIKESQIGYVSNIEGSVKKTGLGGISANKGGIAISLNYSKTLICFVCSHLAAGLNNLDERHQNYKAISKGITFSKYKKIKDHDMVIWMGDFNYRIALPIELVKSLIEKRDFQKLFEFDQLNKQMADGETFPFFDEMEIGFPPTYKFDNNSSEYDTSEKQRIPAWTDRILSMSKGKLLKQELYNSAETVKFSDHRPVYAIFRASVVMNNEGIKRDIMSDIYDNYKRVVGDINTLVTASDVNRFVSEVGDDLLPPPSSETSKWWLEGTPAKVTIQELLDVTEKEVMIVNPRSPVNPFVSSSDPEFIHVKDVTSIYS